MIDPAGARFSITGNVLGVPKPRSPWRSLFGGKLPVSGGKFCMVARKLTLLEASGLNPVPLASSTLSKVGESPSGEVYLHVFCFFEPLAEW